jgi:hypothetical protein
MSSETASSGGASGAGSSKYLKASVGRPALNLQPVFVNEKAALHDEEHPWWQFTIDTGARHVWDHEKEPGEATDRMGPNSEFSKRADDAAARTPGWSDPWTPYRLNTSNPFDALKQFSANLDGEEHMDPADRASSKRQTWWNHLKNFLLLSPWAPFWLRFLNLAFTTTTLALAARILHIELKTDLNGIIGTSTMTALVYSSLTIIHVFVALWLEYFGAPIGVWSVGRKSAFRVLLPHRAELCSESAAHVSQDQNYRADLKNRASLSELIFIALWSAELSLAFDDLFTCMLSERSYCRI